MRSLDTIGALTAVRRLAECEDVLVPAGGVARYDNLPGASTTLVFRVLDAHRGGDVVVVGPRMRALLKRATGLQRGVVLRFRPGWSWRLLGVPASALTGRIVHVDELWGREGRDLVDAMLHTRTPAEVVELAWTAVARRVAHRSEPSAAVLARRAARLFEAGEDRVERVSDALGVTARHLRRAFGENIGIRPKEFVRTLRLRRALQMTASEADWGRIARLTGYYDQAHLIAEFRKLLGVTPKAFTEHRAAP